MWHFLNSEYKHFWLFQRDKRQFSFAYMKLDLKDEWNVVHKRCYKQLSFQFQMTKAFKTEFQLNDWSKQQNTRKIATNEEKRDTPFNEREVKRKEYFQKLIKNTWFLGIIWPMTIPMICRVWTVSRRGTQIVVDQIFSLKQTQKYDDWKERPMNFCFSLQVKILFGME
jgi:hypothetical protein